MHQPVLHQTVTISARHREPYVAQCQDRFHPKIVTKPQNTHQSPPHSPVFFAFLNRIACSRALPPFPTPYTHYLLPRTRSQVQPLISGHLTPIVCSFRVFSTIFSLPDSFSNAQTRSRALSNTLIPYYTSTNLPSHFRDKPPIFEPVHSFLDHQRHFLSFSTNSACFYAIQTSADRLQAPRRIPKRPYSLSRDRTHFRALLLIFTHFHPPLTLFHLSPTFFTR